MKKILMTGQSSYIGTKFKEYLTKWPEKYKVDMINLRDKNWKQTSFSGYDVVYHFAGLAHIRETKDNAHLFFEIDRDLAIEVANKAAQDGVGQFVFLSSMSVYGMNTGIITPETLPNPKSNYGIAKLQAESAINALSSESFKVCTLRPPMVYGKGCKGNFQSFVHVIRKYPIFPKVSNQRSLIYIDNLCAFFKMIADNKLEGLYYPQNKEYMNTSEMARLISMSLGKKVFFSSMLGWCARFLGFFVPKAEKAFGSLIYKDTEKFNFDYCNIELEESVKRSL